MTQSMSVSSMITPGSEILLRLAPAQDLLHEARKESKTLIQEANKAAKEIKNDAYLQGFSHGLSKACIDLISIDRLASAVSISAEDELKKIIGLVTQKYNENVITVNSFFSPKALDEIFNEARRLQTPHNQEKVRMLVSREDAIFLENIPLSSVPSFLEIMLSDECKKGSIEFHSQMGSLRFSVENVFHDLVQNVSNNVSFDIQSRETFKEIILRMFDRNDNTGASLGA